MYVYQGKCRQKELKLLAECMEKILREEKIRETKAGEETLYARLESRLVRIQEMLNGRTEAAEKSKDEIQKLISEIAHQMPDTPCQYPDISGIIRGRNGVKPGQRRMKMWITI